MLDVNLGCYKRGSPKAVASVIGLEAAQTLGWLCGKCCNEIPPTDKGMKHAFGYEGFVDEERAAWEVTGSYETR